MIFCLTFWLSLFSHIMLQLWLYRYFTTLFLVVFVEYGFVTLMAHNLTVVTPVRNVNIEN